MIDPDTSDDTADISTANRPQRITLTVFLLAFISLAGYMALIANHRNEDETSLRASGTHVQAIVEQHYVSTGRTAGRNGNTYSNNNVVVRYDVGAVPVHHTFTVDDDTYRRLTVGRTTELIYNPDNPYLVMMAGPGDTQTGPKFLLVTLFMATFGVGCVIALWVYWLRKRLPN